MSRIACASRAACLLVAPFLASPTLAEQVRDPKGAYSFEPPQGWKISLGEGNVSVVNPLNSAGLMIVVGPKVLDDLNIFANVILNSLKSQTPDRKETGRQGTQLCGFDALLVRSQRTMGQTLMRDEMHVLFTPTRQFCLITQCPAALDAREGDAPLKAMLATLTIEGKGNKAPAKPLLHPLWGTPIGPGTATTDPTPQPKTPDPPFKMKPLRDPRGVWAVNVPADWTAQDHKAYVMASSPDKRVNVTLLGGPAERRSLQDIFQDMIPEMKKHCTSWTLVGTRPLPVAGRQGLNARIESVTQGVELHTDCVLVQNERNLLVVMCICPKTDFAANQLKFGHILDSLRFAADAAPQEPDERNLLNPPLR